MSWRCWWWTNDGQEVIALENAALELFLRDLAEMRALVANLGNCADATLQKILLLKLHLSPQLIREQNRHELA